MHTLAPTCPHLFASQILFSKKALIGLVLFGTEETLNDLAADGQYEHVSVVQPLVAVSSVFPVVSPLNADGIPISCMQPDVDLLRFIENSITPGGHDGDCECELRASFLPVTHCPASQSSTGSW